jgi:ABC-type antimicrobial peptide transport system permease subunit
MTVVGVYGVAGNGVRMTWLGQQASGDKTARIYTARGAQWGRDRILVRTRGPAEAFVPELRRFFSEQAPSLPVTKVLTLEQQDARDFADRLRMIGAVAAGGALALLLASLGLYGVVSLAVRQRTREIGIRIAVGAPPMRVARMFLASGLRTSAVAIALGLPLSVIGLKVGIAQGLFLAPDVNPYLIGLTIAVVLVAVASWATWVPARRAALVDPASTLRVE